MRQMGYQTFFNHKPLPTEDADGYSEPVDSSLIISINGLQGVHLDEPREGAISWLYIGMRQNRHERQTEVHYYLRSRRESLQLWAPAGTRLLNPKR